MVIPNSFPGHLTMAENRSYWIVLGPFLSAAARITEMIPLSWPYITMTLHPLNILMFSWTCSLHICSCTGIYMYVNPNTLFVYNYTVHYTVQIHPICISFILLGLPRNHCLVFIPLRAMCSFYLDSSLSCACLELCVTHSGAVVQNTRRLSIKY